MLKTKREKQRLYRSISAYIVIIAALVVIFIGFRLIDENYRQYKIDAVEEIVTRAVINYYSLYGVYPDTYNELLDKSNISIDDKYTVDYKVFASNIMPDITVIEG